MTQSEYLVPEGVRVPGQLSRGLAIATALMAFVALPLLMTVANKSAPATFALAAVLANGAVLSAGNAGTLLGRYRAMLGTGSARLVVLLIILAVLSFAWTIDVSATRRGLVEAVPEFVSALCLAAAWPLVIRPGDFAWLRYALIASAAVIVFEAFAGMPLHHLFGARAELPDLKRCAVPLTLLLWPAVDYSMARGERGWSFAMVLVALVAALVAHSSASVVGVVAGAGVYVLARVAARPTFVAVSAVAALLLVLAPWTGTILAHVLTPERLSQLSEQHADIRLGLWTNFGTHVWERLGAGHGFDASLRVSSDPRLDHTRDIPMVWNVHPHNVPLQIWIEFGLIGVALAAIALGFCLMRVVRLRPVEQASRLAFMTSAAAVTLVGLNAWGPWWLAVALTCLVCFQILRDSGN